MYRRGQGHRCRLCTYNIWNGSNRGPESSLWDMEQDNLDLGVFQGKFNGWIFTHASAGYRIFATNTLSRNCRGVTIFYRDAPNFQVKVFHKHGPNVLSFQVVSGGWRWFIVRC